MSPGLIHYLAVSGAIFLIGLAGVVVRRNIIVVYMCLELMLAAGVLAPWNILISPAVGALLMSLSTIIVAINAQLLRGVRLDAS